MNERAQLIERGAVSLPDYAAVLNRRRRFVNDGARQQVRHILQRVERVARLAEIRARTALHARLERRHFAACAFQGFVFARRRAAIDDTRHQPFQIKYAGQRIDQVAAQHRIGKKLLHSVEPFVDDCRIYKRLVKPGAHQTLSHRRFRPVKHPQQRAALFACTHRLRQLQIAPRRQIERHRLFGVYISDVGDAFKPLLLRLIKIREQRAKRARRERPAVKPERAGRL